MQTLKEIKFLGLLLLLCLYMSVYLLRLPFIRLMTFKARWENFQDYSEIGNCMLDFLTTNLVILPEDVCQFCLIPLFAAVKNYCTHLNISFHLAPSWKVVKIKLTHDTDSAIKLFSLNYYTQTYLLH